MNYTLNKGGKGVIVNPSNRASFVKYLSYIAKYSPLTREKEIELFRRIKENNDEFAREMICRHNMLFVVSVARSYVATTAASTTLTLEDLVCEGNMGLYEAIDNFDPDSGNKFISYAVWKIRHRILESIKNNMKTIRMPHSMYKELNDVYDKKSRLEQELGRSVTLFETFDKLAENGETRKSDTYSRLAHLDRMSKFEKSLNSTFGEDGEIEISETIKSDDLSAHDEIVNDEKKDFINKMLNQLPDDVLKYFIDYYGLSGEDRMTFKQISEKYGVSDDVVNNKVKLYLKILKRDNKKEFEDYR